MKTKNQIEKFLLEEQKHLLKIIDRKIDLC